MHRCAMYIQSLVGTQCKVKEKWLLDLSKLNFCTKGKFPNTVIKTRQGCYMAQANYAVMEEMPN